MQGIHMLSDRQSTGRSKRWSLPSPRTIDLILLGFVVVVVALACRYGLADGAGKTTLPETYSEILKTHVTPHRGRQKPALDRETGPFN